MMKDFNAIAATWDEKPQRIHLAAAVSRAIRQQIPLRTDMRALDFGSGTGLVTFHLVGELGQVTAMDSAEKMLDVFMDKARQCGVTNVNTAITGADPAVAEASYDLIYSSMVLHHVPDLDLTLRRLVAGLASGGYLALADLDAEDGDFHDNPAGVARHGVERDWLCRRLEQLGLHKVAAVTAHVITKQRQGRDKDFPVFLVCGQRR